MLRKTIAVVLTLVFCALPMVALAQEDLSETYTTSDGSLTFMHPAGWVVEGFGSLAIISNDENFSNAADFDTVPSGTTFAFISAGPWSDIGAEIDTSGGVTAMGAIEQLMSQPDSPELTEGPTQLDIGADAVMIVGVEEGNDLMAIIIAVDDESGVFFVAGAAEGELNMFRDTLIAIAASISYAPPDPNAGAVAGDTGPSAVAGTGAVAWQQQRPNDFVDGAFGSLGAVAVAPDGTIYVADGFNGIRVLDADGNVTGTITNNTITNIDDMELADDGTLWLIDGFDGLAYNLATDGTLLNSFGEKGSGPGQFGEFSPDSFDIGPDGNLYFFDSQQVSDTETVGRIQVFDTQGTFLREFPTDPNGDGRLTSFIRIAVGPDGNVYAADFFSGMTIFDPQGSIIDDNYGEATFQLNTPQAIDFGPNGAVYVATNDGLFVLNNTGAVTAQFGMRQEFPDGDETPPLEPGEFSSISGLGVAPNGDAIIADTNFAHSQIVRVSLEGLGTSPTAPAGSPDKGDAAPPADTSTDSEQSGGSLADAIQSGDAAQAAPAAAGGEVRQWASGASATSQYSDPSWSAMQATGAPDTEGCGDITTAWASSSSNTQETLTVTYAQAVIATQINIYQTFNPGSITSVAVIPADGSAPVDLPNSADSSKNTPCPGVFTINVTDQTAPVNGVVIHLDQSIIGNWNEIDAVELVGTAP